MKLRATFASVLRQSIVVLHDHSAQTGARSIARDARAVVAYCLRVHGNYRIIFRDSAGTWRELLHDGENHLQTAALPGDYLARIADYHGPVSPE